MSARSLMSGARVITTGKQLIGQCDGTTANNIRPSAHVGPNALLRSASYPKPSAARGSGPLTSPTLPVAGYWRIDGSTEYAAGGLATSWASGATTTYAYSNSASNTGGLVPSGGMTIDGFAVPAGTAVYQFMDISAGQGAYLTSGAPDVVFRGVRARAAWSDPQPFNCQSVFTASIWLLYCDLGGTGAGANTSQRGSHIDNGAGVSVYRCYYSYCATCHQPEVQGSGANDFIECYTEKLSYLSSSPHLDGYIIEGGETCARIQRNRMVYAATDENGNTVNQTTCIGLWNGTGSSSTNPLPGTGTNPDGTTGYQVSGNYVGGTGYCFYLGDVYSATVAGVNFTNNLVTTTSYSSGGADGATVYPPTWGSSGNAKSGNLWADGSSAGTSFI